MYLIFILLIIFFVIVIASKPRVKRGGYLLRRKDDDVHYEPELVLNKKIGCYIIPKSFRDLPGFTSNKMNCKSCIDYCRKKHYNYAGLIDGNKCLCFDSRQNTKRIPLRKCNVRCSGNLNEKCGGENNVLVFGLDY